MGEDQIQPLDQFMPGKGRCLLHFGMHKTGSSSIQASLFRAPLGDTYRYVDLGTDNPTGPLLNIFQGPELRYRDLERRGTRLDYEGFVAERESLKERLKEEMYRAQGKVAIISAEGLNVLSEAELAGLRDFLFKYVGSINAFAYVRPPKGFMESIFQQLVKGRLGRLDFYKLYPEYRQRFEKFDRVFGRENVHYQRFDPKAFPACCVVRDFCERFEIPLAGDRIVRINEGLSRNAVALLYAHRKYERKVASAQISFRGERRLLDELGTLGGPKLQFAPEAIGPVLKARQADLEWMETRVGASLRESGARDDVGSIRDEAELLRFDWQALRWLAERVGYPLDVGRVGVDGHSSGTSVGGDRHPATQWSTRILVGVLGQVAPELLDGISNAQAVTLLNEVFRVVGQRLGATGEGSVTIPSLGHFRMRGSEKTEGGTASQAKRILFQPMSREEEVAQGVNELLLALSVERPGGESCVPCGG